MRMQTVDSIWGFEFIMMLNRAWIVKCRVADDGITSQLQFGTLLFLVWIKSLLIGDQHQKIVTVSCCDTTGTGILPNSEEQKGGAGILLISL